MKLTFLYSFAALFITGCLAQDDSLINNMNAANINGNLRGLADTTPTPICSYPQWTIPGVGTDTRCDHPEGCPKRPCTPCAAVYGITAGKSCEVYCANNGNMKETWYCSSSGTWVVQEGGPMTC